MAYVDTASDIGRRVTIEAEYAGFKARTYLDFTSDATLAPRTSGSAAPPAR
jgi:hypothetical protein